MLTLLLLLALARTVQCRYHHTWSVELHPGADPHQVADNLNMDNLGGIGSIPHHYLFKHREHPRYSDAHSHLVTTSIHQHRHVRAATQQIVRKRVKRKTIDMPKRDSEFNFHDPYFPKQWYLYDEYNNVTGAWRQGVSGKGVVVTILDDGIERTHPDLQPNYEARASTDLNDNDDDPMPRYDITNENKHGTRCAGEVASIADNQVCGVGAAYHSRIGGVRMLDGDVTDAIEARALGLNQDFIDIYSASWGPDDDGRTVDGPGHLTVTSFTTGVQDGRDGRGSIFVWASGNGGVSFDNCNCDGYTNSIWTLSIGSTSENGLKPWYAEECSSTLAVTYSSGSSKERQILSTDLHNKCTERHTGTSAAAPLAAGIFALVLQANPLLGWRDMQHLVVRTAKPRNLQDAGWVTNGAGYDVSHKFGFGVIDAGGLVELAQMWNNMPDAEICESDVQNKEKNIGGGKEEKYHITSDGCDGRVRFLEHVQCLITIEADKRGDISIQLISPQGTVTTLLTPRRYDRSTKGFKNWPFLNVHTWGENPAGTWELKIRNNGVDRMKLISWQLVLHGTTTQPELRSTKISIPDPDHKDAMQCDSHCDPNFGCSGPGPGNCTACAHYLQQSTNVCVDICGPGEHLNRKGTICIAHCDTGEYVNPSGQCAACASNCESCDGPAETECTACHNGHLLLVSDHTCVSTCPANTITKDGQCELCHADCLTCTDVGYDKCVTCQPSLFFHGNRCYQSCPTGYYGDAVTKTCVACATGCSSCFGPEDNECVACNDGLFLAESRCRAACPPSYYTTGDDRVCRRCHYTCETCTGDSVHQCSTCIASYFLLSGSCLRACPTGYFSDHSTHTCAQCAEHCTACNGTASNQCVSCSPGYTLNGQVCDPACPSGQYSYQNQCIPCGENCVTCTDKEHCVACDDSTFRYQGRCLTQCPEFMFKRDKACLPCDREGACAECDHAGHCHRCKEGYQLQEGVCENPCGRGYYVTDDGSCHTCSTNCDTCLGGSELACTSCHDESVTTLMERYNYQGKVYCGACSSGCELCTQNYNNYCISCHSGLHLLRDQTHKGRASCVSECPAGTSPARINTLSECVPCDPSCETCTGSSSSECTSCPNSMLLEEHTCKAACSESFYADGTQCLPCNNVCKSCNGPSQMECITCPPGLVRQDNTCTYTCKSEFYQNGDQCEACFPTCVECSGSSDHQCSSCIAGFTLAEDRCVNACTQGLYNDPVLHTCRPCHVTCANCTAEGPAHCLACKSSLVKNLETHECWQCCSETVRERCCYCTGAAANTCTDHVVNHEEHGGGWSWSPGVSYVLGAVIVLALLGVLLYPLHYWKKKQGPSYRLLADQDSDEMDNRVRINQAYRDKDEEDFVTIHS